MKNEWSLDALYLSFTDAAYLSDLQIASTLANKYEVLACEYLSHHNEEIQAIEHFLNHRIADTKRLQKLQAFGHLKFAADTKCQEAIVLKSKVHTFWNQLTPSMVAFKYWLKDVSDLDALASQSPFIASHLFYLSQLKRSAQHLLSQEEELLIAQLSTTGSSAWEMLQSKTTSQVTEIVSIDGIDQALPIMAIRNLAFHTDPSVRRAGYEAEMRAYEKHAEISAAALNSIKGEVITLAKLRGFESPLSEALFNARMTPEVLSAMLSAIEEFLPQFRRYLQIKAKALGHKNGLPFYDLFAPLTQADQTYSIEEAKAFIVKYYGDFSPELSRYAERAFEQEWVDFEPREGKRGGAFCSNLPSIGESRILVNFNGKLKNVLTLAHELGHGFHGHCLKTESILNTTYPMPIAETASIFCETIVRNAVLKEADRDLAITILENSLQSATQVTVDILSRFYFESEVFSRRQDHPLSVGELKTMMSDAQKKSYGDALDASTLHPFMWLNKPHYYYAQQNFYNFPYAFGLLFSRGLYAQYLKDPDHFPTRYVQMLSETGKRSIQDLCKLMSVDPSSVEFWRESLKMIQADIDLFEKMLEI